MTVSDDESWVTRPRDTRERTCGHSVARLFSVRHAFRVARDPDPTGVTVTRTHEATVEWTSELDLPAWLSEVAEVLTPYEADRFGTDGASGTDATADGRFLAAPVEATIRPGGSGPVESEPYHYWNTPLVRVREDDGYPADVVSATLDLVDGPEAVWTGASTAGGIDGRSLDGDIDAYSRVGVTVTGRERFRRPAHEDGPEPTDAAAGNGTVDRGSARAGEDATVGDGAEVDRWEAVGQRSVPTLDFLGSIVDATVAPQARAAAGVDVAAADPVAGATRTVQRRTGAAWTAFELADGDDGGSPAGTVADPYRVPDAAVRAAADRAGDSS
ncbi:MAG: hypothetical protein ACI9YT_001805 [Halobacteriales archaeon]|jgi:hypothetical protein